MSYKKIEQSREARLWLGQIIIPAVSAVVLLVANPDVRFWFREQRDKIKCAINNRRYKKGES